MSLLLSLFAFAAADAAVISTMARPEGAVLRAEILARPAGTSAGELIGALAAEARAAGWERSEETVDGPPFRFTMTGFRAPEGEGALAFFSRADEDPARSGRLCRISVAETRPPEENEMQSVGRFCLAGIAAEAPLPPPRRR